MINDFVTTETLATYAGTITMVVSMTQIVKKVGFFNKLDPQITSFLMAFLVIGYVQFSEIGFSYKTVMLVLFNSVTISLASNGLYDGVLSKKKPDGSIIVNKNDSVDNYLLALDIPLDELEEREKIILHINKKD